MRLYLRILFVLLSCLLLAASTKVVFGSFEWQGIGVLAWFALVPLILAVMRSSVRTASALAFLFAFAYYLLMIFWMGHALYFFGGYSVVATVVTVVFACITQAFFPTAAIGLALFVSRRWKGELIVWLSVMWVAFEFLRSYVPFGGFPWANLAVSQFGAIYAIQMAGGAGMCALSFILRWVQCFIAGVIASIGTNRNDSTIPKAVITAVLLLAVFTYGHIRVSSVSKEIDDSPKIKVAALQGNIRQSDKMNESLSKRNLGIYAMATKKVIPSHPYLIIWPETSFPWTISRSTQSIAPSLMGLLSAADADFPYLLFGSVTDTNPNDAFNSALLMNSNGKLIDIYDKVHLAPFGEYIPLRWFFSFMPSVAGPVGGDFVRGEGVRLLNAGGLLIGPLICYEEIFPAIAREETLLGADLLVNISSNAWFGRTSAPYQQMAMSVFRAVENRRFLIRATNTGVSSVITPVGEISVQSPIFERANIVSDVAVMDSLTLYSLYGDWFAYGCTAYAIVGLIFSLMTLVRQRKRRT